MNARAMPIPAFCSGCGLVFPSAVTVVGGGYEKGGGAKIRNCAQNCPRCGKMADILSGDWICVENGLKLLNGPDATKEVLYRFKVVLEGFSGDEGAAEALAEQIENEFPAFSMIAQWIKLHPELAVTIASFLLQLISFIFYMQQSGATPREIERHYYHDFNYSPKIEEPVKPEVAPRIRKVESSKTCDRYSCTSPYAPKGIEIRIKKR